MVSSDGSSTLRALIGAADGRVSAVGAVRGADAFMAPRGEWFLWVVSGSLPAIWPIIRGAAVAENARFRLAVQARLSRLVPAHPRVQHHIRCLGGRAQHAIGDPVRAGAKAIEGIGGVVHGW